MKKFILYPFLGILGLIFLILLTAAGILFFKPTLVINKKNIEYGINKAAIFSEWKWKTDLNYEWKSWDDRHIHGSIQDFCFKMNQEALKADACFEKITWDFDLTFGFSEGIKAITNIPFTVRSSRFWVMPKETDKKPEPTSPPDIKGYWDMLWASYVPDIDVLMKKIIIASEKDKKETELDLKLIKSGKKLEVVSMDFTLKADPEKITVLAPETYKIPGDIKTRKPLHLKGVKLVAYMNDEGIPVELTGKLETADINAKSYIELPLRGTFDSLAFRKDVFLKTSADILLKDVRSFAQTYAPEPYNELPAPLNVLDGQIEFHLKTSELKENECVLVSTSTGINLKGKKQALVFGIGANIPLNVLDLSRGTITINVDFEDVAIELPRLSKKSPPPQFMPDGRFKTSEKAKKEELAKKTPGPKIDMDLEALNEQALHINSNLLDEALRLNFDLKIRQGEVKTGFLKVLPLKTSVFKRPIRVKDLVVNFHAPKEPTLKSQILFPLPEYKITLNLEGPVSDPRYSFTSVPPLPQNDIFAVLLFGRPLKELDPDDKSSAQQTNQILAQGILSLSVLYFLAGSPVEYVGYDPNSKRAVAQVGLTKKSSLRVGTGEGGPEAGVRRSLGKGWYIDTSVQKTNGPTNQATQDYGVLLERIIAY